MLLCCYPSASWLTHHWTWTKKGCWNSRDTCFSLRYIFNYRMWRTDYRLEMINCMKGICKETEYPSCIHAHVTTLTEFVELSPPLELNSYSVSQEITRNLWRPKVQCHIHRSELNQFSKLQCYFFKILFKNIPYIRLDLPRISFLLVLRAKFVFIYLLSNVFLHALPILFSVILSF